MTYLPKGNQDTFRLLSDDDSLLPEAKLGAERRCSVILNELGANPITSLHAKALEEVQYRGFKNVLPETESFARQAMYHAPNGGLPRPAPLQPPSSLPPFCSGH